MAKRQRKTGAEPAEAIVPASKRQKTSQTGLGFLVDDNVRGEKPLEARLTNGVPKTKATRVDESHAKVLADTGAENDDSSDASDAEDASSESDDDEADGVEDGQANGGSDVDMKDGPTFGELALTRHADPIEVESARAKDTTTLVRKEASATTSLSSALTQALRVNDTDLLESCLKINDLPSIQATIERLQPTQAVTLLVRLSERIHKRPGRASHLMLWVRWTLVSHGGFLATQPEPKARMRTLSQVVRNRGNGLSALLQLKGKLDMLNAQLELRQRIEANKQSDAETEEVTVYVEGESGSDFNEDDSSDDGQAGDGDDVASRSSLSDEGDESSVELVSDEDSGDASDYSSDSERSIQR
ncbi:NUC189-domain-containing protein [Piedraia hortae CBS 480.64]|uniref:NUC189-domain-containing protein n=1 Tax=Piedraia hortae CBS 480.64 TaxID=1314780 RepID=A0A6A7C4R4_9PEZI|nr:NUC189-domain-containing protein [Piedraia hortae CBS 480.64]